ncbi:hypothetical protein DH2020_020195 [Rehmannia glutinosa]|uniref:Uncharacterized protein n=1 Tax=Rehmannia glutinosa TaxID=99300 RepID=A0ABR0WIC0_REHGL
MAENYGSCRRMREREGMGKETNVPHIARYFRHHQASRRLDRTVRVDPLDNLKKYRGGYDITNQHYWSVSDEQTKVIIACGIVVEGDSKFHCRAKTVIDVIIDAAEKASDTIHNTTGAMKDMNSSLTQVDGSSKATEFLTLTSQRLDSQATNIERQAYKNRDLIDKGLNFIFAGDTCMAIEGFQQNPYNNSFSSILPCDELLSAKSVLTSVSAGIYDLLNKVNGNIYTSYGNILQICNPFSSPPMYEYQPWDCPPTSTQIGDVPQVLRMLACPDSEGETCNGGILIPANYYNTVEPYSTSIQTLLDAYPGMENLVQCQTIKDAFTEILHKHCKPLERYVRIIWTSLVFLALVLVALVLIWTIGADHEQNHHSLTGSVNPNYADVIERGTSKPTNNSESGLNHFFDKEDQISFKNLLQFIAALAKSVIPSEMVFCCASKVSRVIVNVVDPKTIWPKTQHSLAQQGQPPSIVSSDIL